MMGYHKSISIADIWKYDIRYTNVEEILERTLTSDLVIYSGSVLMDTDDKIIGMMKGTGYGLIFRGRPEGDIANTATVNNLTGFDLDKIIDHNDSTYTTNNTTVSSGETKDIGIWDFGSVKPRFVYYKIATEFGTYRINLQTSEDGNEYTTKASKENGSKSGWFFDTFRYIKWQDVNNRTGAEENYSKIYTLEVYDAEELPLTKVITVDEIKEQSIMMLYSQTDKALAELYLVKGAIL